jgi:hypothetical protein
MIAAIGWSVLAATAVWGVWMTLCLWRDRPRVVRGTDDRWRAAPRPRNGYGPKR